MKKDRRERRMLPKKLLNNMCSSRTQLAMAHSMAVAVDLSELLAHQWSVQGWRRVGTGPTSSEQVPLKL